MTERSDKSAGNCERVMRKTLTLFPAALFDCISVKSFNYVENSLLPHCLPSNICLWLSLIYVFIILPSDAENYWHEPMLFYL